MRLDPSGLYGFPHHDQLPGYQSLLGFTGQYHDTHNVVHLAVSASGIPAQTY